MRATGLHLRTERLVLVAATALHVRTELETPDRLAHLLEAVVSPAWPSGEYDRDAMEYFLRCFEEGGAAAEGWYGWYALLAEAPGAPAELMGSGGFLGPPAPDGSVEIGYSVLPEHQRHGYASEMVRALVGRAFSFPAVGRVIAHTNAANAASVAVLERCGFQLAPGSPAEGLRFEIARSA